MSYYPIFLELKEKTVLVVGGGRVAQRKIETMLEYGAIIHIVSRKLTEKLKKLVESGIVNHLGAEFRAEQLKDVFLVIAATNDKKLNHKISEKARSRGLLINAVDQPEDCNFIVPSIVKSGDLMIAVSTSGKSPALAKKIRKELEFQFGTEYGTFLSLMGRIRNEVLTKDFCQSEKTRIFNEIINAGLLEALANNDLEYVKNRLSNLLPVEIDVENILKYL